MDPRHTYLLAARGARGVVIGALAGDPAVQGLLRELWRVHGASEPGERDGVSYIPSEKRARVTVTHGDELRVFDVDVDPHPVASP